MKEFTLIKLYMSLPGLGQRRNEVTSMNHAYALGIESDAGYSLGTGAYVITSPLHHSMLRCGIGDVARARY